MNDKESVDVMEVEIYKNQDIIMSEYVFYEDSNQIMVEEKGPQPCPKKNNNRNKKVRSKEVLEIRVLTELSVVRNSFT